MKKLRVTVEGKSYEVLVEMLDDAGAVAAPRAVVPAAPVQAAVIAAPVSAPVASSPARGSAGIDDIPSPLAGKVVSIDVQVGQAVAAGAQVATVEAMKMNTYIYASKAGTVAAVLVNAGDGVEEGTALLRIT